MKNKERIIFASIFCWWVILVGLLLTFTWPPTMAVVLIWFACGVFTASVYISGDRLSPVRRDLKEYLSFIWIIWYLLGTVSLLVFLSMVWHKHRTSGWYPGKTIR